jgi:hypothetical protein
LIQNVTYLYTSMVTNFDILDQIAYSDNNTGTFMTSNQGQLCGQRPVAV